MIYRIFLSFLILFCLPFDGFAQNHSTVTPQTQSKNIMTPLKHVQTIYLGFIQGEPVKVGYFYEQLAYYLKKYGFTVVTSQKNADAILLGSFQVFTISDSQAKVILIDPNYNKIWYYKTEAPFFMGSEIFKLGAYLSNTTTCACKAEKWRAIYISQALKKAKEQALLK